MEILCEIGVDKTPYSRMFYNEKHVPNSNKKDIILAAMNLLIWLSLKISENILFTEILRKICKNMDFR